MARVAIAGATGALGGRVARRLAERDVALRLIVRDAERAPDLSEAEIAIAAGYSDREAMRGALEGCETFFMVSGREQLDRVAEHKAAADAAVAAGVRNIVYTSFLGAAPDATFTLARHHWATEEHIREGPMRYAFLRDSLYMDVIPWLPDPERVIRGPAGTGQLAPVDRDSIAAVAAEVICAFDDHEYATYDLTGPDLFTLAEAAAVLTQFSGREIHFHDETIDEAWASRARYGAPDWEVEGWVTSYAAIAAGELALVTDEVERITGVRPPTLAEFLEREPESYTHLRDGPLSGASIPDMGN